MMFNFYTFNRFSGIIDKISGFLSSIKVFYNTDTNTCSVCWDGKSYHHEREAMWQVLSYLNREDPKSNDGKHFYVNDCEVRILKY